MTHTKTQIAALVRKVRSTGSYAVRNTNGEWQKHVREYPCPIDRTHKFTASVLPWEDPTTVKAVTYALTEHLKAADDNGEPCVARNAR